MGIESPLLREFQLNPQIKWKKTAKICPNPQLKQWKLTKWCSNFCCRETLVKSPENLQTIAFLLKSVIFIYFDKTVLCLFRVTGVCLHQKSYGTIGADLQGKLLQATIFSNVHTTPFWGGGWLWTSWFHPEGCQSQVSKGVGCSWRTAWGSAPSGKDVVPWGHTVVWTKTASEDDQRVHINNTFLIWSKPVTQPMKPHNRWVLLNTTMKSFKPTLNENVVNHISSNLSKEQWWWFFLQPS